MNKRLKAKKKLIQNPVVLAVGLVLMIVSEIIYNVSPDSVVVCTILLVAALAMVVVSVWPKKSGSSPIRKR